MLKNLVHLQSIKGISWPTDVICLQNNDHRSVQFNANEEPTIFQNAKSFKLPSSTIDATIKLRRQIYFSPLAHLTSNGIGGGGGGDGSSGTAVVALSK